MLYNTKKCIGIISYFPDNKTRNARIKRFENLIKQCKKLFVDIPVIVIAQNWNDYENDYCITYKYDKLGITHAREKLREKLLEYKYADQFILMDDDCIWFGDSSKDYLHKIDEHPFGFGIFNGTLLKGVHISRFVLENVPLPQVSIDTKEGYAPGFEDACWIYKIKYEMKGLTYDLTVPTLNEVSHDYVKDGAESTWFNGKIIDRIKKGNRDYIANLIYNNSIKEVN